MLETYLESEHFDDTPEAKAAYLNAALAEMDDDPCLLMKAVRNVAEAQGEVTQVVEQGDPE